MQLIEEGLGVITNVLCSINSRGVNRQGWLLYIAAPPNITGNFIKLVQTKPEN